MEPVKFRKATGEDVLRIVELLREFYAKQGDIYGIPFSTISTISMVADLVVKEACVIGPSSCAAATLSRYPYNHKAILAKVMFWYFRKPREIEILDYLITACRARGATHFAVASHFPDHRIGRWYAKKGMRPVEAMHLVQL